MKTKIYFLLTCLATMFACSDSVLDKRPLDKFSEEDVWGDINLAKGFIASTYGVVEWLAGEDDWTDNVISNGGSFVAKEQFDKYRDFGWNVYKEVRKCNLIIERVEASDFHEQAKKPMIAEGKMLRAIIYFKQARLFGKVMLVDRVLSDNDNFKIPRTTTIKDTYDFILKDLHEALEDLPEKAELGKLTKGAALALIAEVALHGASYIETGQEAYYQQAITASEELFKLDYVLDTNYEKLFNDNEYAKQSKEIILALWRHPDNTSYYSIPMQTRFPNLNNGNLYDKAPKLEDGFFYGWANKFPSQSLVDDYWVVDKDGAAKKWDETSYYTDFKSKGGSVHDAIYTHRDLRFYASVVHDSSKFFNSMLYIRDGEGGNAHWYSNKFEPGVWCNTKTGYYFRKRIYETATPTYDRTPYHYVILRLGRSYLNYAEVLLRQNKIEKAIEYINKTREIHGGLPEIPTGISIKEAWALYKIERRVDLFDECDRYWSLLRWAKADKQTTIPELTEEFTAINIAEDGQSFEIIPLPFNRNENSSKVFTERRFLLPVPEGERLLNTSLDQNPGW